ncbi:hypothetical protein E0493_11875 [Roseomonas sp. M0104]|uniref:MipA/OmpV family protein n=1 Tax=Teichococcus coralli TaxID=2545983 RepID=A0A845BFN5_9PROT|nr:hypothetical protein [Pseudoroseomonas coralli]MXP64042.1 hypothetical protein [Pseudoroseomonas coralli]
MNASRILLGAAALLGLAGTLPAQARLEAVTQGESFANPYAPEFRGNVVGGGYTREVSLGQDSAIVYSDPSIGRRASGIPFFVGGHSEDVVYRPSPAMMPTSFATRQR